MQYQKYLNNNLPDYATQSIYIAKTCVNTFAYNGSDNKGECYFPSWVNSDNHCFFYYMYTIDKGSIYISSFGVKENTSSYYVEGRLYYFKSGEWEYVYSSNNTILSVNKNNITEITSSSSKKYYRYTKGDIDVVIDEQGVSYSPNDETAPFNDLDGDGISNDEDDNNDGSNNYLEGTDELKNRILEAYIEKYNEKDVHEFGSVSIHGHYAAGTVITIDGKKYTFNEDFYLLQKRFGTVPGYYTYAYYIVPDSGIKRYDDETENPYEENTYITMYDRNGYSYLEHFHTDITIGGGGSTGGGSTGGGDTGGGSTGGGDTGGGSTGGGSTGGGGTGGGGTGGGGTGGGDTGGGDTGGGDTIIIGDGNPGEGNESGYGVANNWFPSTELIQSITHLNNALTAQIGVDIAATITAARINAVANQQKIGIFYIPLQGIWVKASTQYVEINIYKYANEDFVIIIRRMLAVLIFLTTAIIILTVLRQY